jgi:hypothetical protein
MKYINTMTEQIFSLHNLSIANRFIEDDVPTIAYEIDTTDEVFNLKLTTCTATKTE